MNAFFSFYLSLCVYQWVNEERSRSGRKHLTAAELPRPLTASPNPAHGQRHREETEKTSPQRSRSSKRIKLSFSQTSNLPGRWAPCLSLEHPSSAAFHLQLQGATREATSLFFLFFVILKQIFRGTRTLTLHHSGLTCYAITKATRFTLQVYHEAQLLALCKVPLSAAAVAAHEQPINKTLNSSFAEAHLFC